MVFETFPGNSLTCDKCDLHIQYPIKSWRCNRCDEDYHAECAYHLKLTQNFTKKNNSTINLIKKFRSQDYGNREIRPPNLNNICSCVKKPFTKRKESIKFDEEGGVIPQ